MPKGWGVVSFAKSIIFGSTEKECIPESIEDDTSTIKTKDASSIVPPNELHTQSQNSTFFAGARRFVVRDSTMIEQHIQIFENSETVFKLLEHKRIHGAEVDSSARHPPPKCHPNTRTKLRGAIIAWVLGTGSDQQMLWILGPAGVGKSAIAQTVAEHCQDIGRLGAAFFFSRPNERDDPLCVIPTLAYQLSVRCPDYRRLIAQRLAEDPSILEKDVRSQFRMLLAEPFKIIRSKIKQPLLIVLDGLDECKGQQAQCEFIGLISEHVRQKDKVPLLWMICSRPEWHLKRLIRDVGLQQVCDYEELSIDDPESQQDVYSYLQDGFNDIRARYWDIIDVDEDKPWPPEAQLRQLATAASGLFIFASTVLKFIGDDNLIDQPDVDDGTHDTPNNRLARCLIAVDGITIGISTATNPLRALDLLYQQILLMVPARTLSTVMCILSIRVRFNGLNAQDVANFLCLDQSEFYSSLRRLHSILEIPPPNAAASQPLQFYHASFGDFLRDPGRSGQFFLDMPQVRCEIAVLSFRWYNRAIQRHCQLGDNPCHVQSPELKWSPGRGTSVRALLKTFDSCISSSGWDMCCVKDDKDIANVIAELSQVQFCHLAPSAQTGFFRFINWVNSLGDRNGGLIRVSENCKTDRQLLESYGRPMTPANFPLKFDWDRTGVYYQSLHFQDGWRTQREPTGMFFLGHGTRTCLIRIYR